MLLRPLPLPGAPPFALLLLSLSLLTPAAAAAPPDFWAHWSDGKAELDGYALVESRYGQPRTGTAVLIFVTEDFSDSLRVKADPGRHPPADLFPVLKLNAVRDFQTGIYDYNLLTSVFTRIDGGFVPAKISFGSQEWCGNVYQHWLLRGERLEGVSHSYFDGEADQAPALAVPPGALFEDALPVVLRGLRGDFLPPGGARTAPLFTSAIRARFEHRAQQFRPATIRRDAAERTVASALGTILAFDYAVSEEDGGSTRYTLEAAYPHRLLAWSRSAPGGGGESGRLLGSARLPYWQLNENGGERYLKEIGLAPAPPAGSREPVRPPPRTSDSSRKAP